MRRYKKSKCRNGWKQCGNSTRCWPPETKCRDVNEKRVKQKTEKSSQSAERKVPIAAIIGASVATTAIVGGLAYTLINNRKGKAAYIPKKAETQRDPKSVYTSQGYDAAPSIETIPHEKAIFKGSQNQFKNESIEAKFANQDKARKWAQEVLNDPDTVILDLETTSLMQGVDPYNPDDWKTFKRDIPGITQIGIIDANLETGYDIKLNPERKLSDPSIAAMTGYDEKAARGKPNFKAYYPYLKEKLEGKRVLAFNGRFDFQVIDALCEQNGLPLIQYKNRPLRVNVGTISKDPPMGNDADVMHWFALYKYKGARPSLKRGEYDVDKGLAYTSLPTIPGGKDHDAFTDILSTYDVLRIMADGKKPYGMSPSEERNWNMYEDRKRRGQ